MSSVARTCIAATMAFIAGAVACWWLTPESKPAAITVPKAIRPKPGIIKPDRWTTYASWKEAPTYYQCFGVLSGRRRVLLPTEFSGRSDATDWVCSITRCLSPGHEYRQDPNWHLLVLSHAGSGIVVYNALFIEHAPTYARDPKPWKVRWVSYNAVDLCGVAKIASCAWIEPDSRTLIIATRDGRTLSISRLPRKVRHL